MTALSQKSLIGCLLVNRDDCSPEAWQLLEDRSRQIHELQDELLKAHKRLCKYGGHLPITDSEGRTWCELCQSEVKP